MDDFISLACGDATEWKGDGVGLVFTNPYAAIPAQLHNLPMIISLHHPAGKLRHERITKAEDWCGGPLMHLSDWGKRNAIYVRNLPWKLLTIRELEVDTTDAPPNVGWFPLELCVMMLNEYRDAIPEGARVWDGFCGRATVGKACHKLGIGYVGIDIDPERIALARKYLELA